MNTFRSFDGIRIAYHDEGKGPAVVLLHGGYLDELGPLPNPPIEGRPGLVRAKILENGEMVPGLLASANLIGCRVTGTDPKVMVAVIRGALLECACRNPSSELTCRS